MSSTVASIRYRFGRFELLPEERQLLADGGVVHVGPHAFDLLVVLAEHSGKLVTKDELLERVWPHAVVEENTLQVHVSALRKVLGAEAIATVAGRGYRFVVDVEHDAPPSVAPKHNLPNQLTSFIGREPEIAQVGQLLTSTRLLTLTGAGGCGKTRLALQAASDIVDRFADGVWFVELAPLGEARLVPQAVAGALEVDEQPGKGVTETLTAWLGSRQLLLILDNAEHLLGACAQLAEHLLRRCARLIILVTSRERLGIAGEVTYRVPSLSVVGEAQEASGGGALACEAARLFIERARLQRPDFDVSAADATALASICRRLDGIALAIELAAPRVRHMSLQELSSRLDHRFGLLTGGSRTALPRHRTLRSLIDWSYDLLADAEKTVLQRVSVFAGGWTLEAAERVCTDANIHRDDVLELLTSLTDKNLAVAGMHEGPTRFGLLETVRHYAQDRLRDRNEENEVRARHVEYFLDVAEKLAEQQQDSDRHAKLSRLDKEHDNLRAALSWCEASAPCAPSGLRLAGKLYWFWRARGHFNEGRDWVRRLLAVATDGGQEKDRATALTTAGVLAYLQGDYPAAEAHCNEALPIRRRLGERRHVAALLQNLGSVELVKANDPQQRAARALYQEALSIARDLGDRRDTGFVLHCLGILAVATYDYLAAQTLFEESLSIRQEFGSLGAAETRAELGKLMLQLDDHRNARIHLTEALAAEREFGNRHGIAKALVWLAIVSHDERDVAAAREQLSEALEILQALADRVHMATALETAAGLALELSGPTEAARLFGGVQRLRDEFDVTRQLDFEGERCARLLADARTGLHDDAAFDRAWDEGRSLTPDEVVRRAMEHLKQP